MDNIALWVYCSLSGSDTMLLLFKEQRQIEVENRILKLSCVILHYDTWHPNRCTNSLRKVIIYYIPTQSSNLNRVFSQDLKVQKYLTHFLFLRQLLVCNCLWTNSMRKHLIIKKCHQNKNRVVYSKTYPTVSTCQQKKVGRTNGHVKKVFPKEECSLKER